MRAHKNSYSAGDDPIFQDPDMAAAGESGLVRMEGLNSQPQYSSRYIWLGKLNEVSHHPSHLLFLSAEDFSPSQKSGTEMRILLLIRFLCILY